MRGYIFNGILLLFCILFAMRTPPDASFFLCLFITVALDALLFLLPAPVRYGATACYSLVSCFWQIPFLFLPVITYHILLILFSTDIRKSWPSGLLALFSLIIPFSCHIGELTVFSAAGLFFIWLLALALSWQFCSYERLRNLYIHTMDESKERQLLLMEKNQAILDRQNSEIHTATLQERNRIAREIHDNVGHLLTRSILMTGAIRTMNQAEELRSPVCQLEETLNQAMTSIRESVHNLHDDALNLEGAVEQLIREFRFCPVSFRYDMGYDLPKDIRYAFLAIVKEALANTCRHSNATAASVLMREHPGFYQLIIEDNGTAVSRPSHTHGIGLSNMEERIRQLRGTISFQTENGFRIVIIIPKEEEQT